MTIGATEGKEPDYIADEDLVSLDVLRGDMKVIKDAKLSLGDQATVAGVLQGMEAMKKIMAEDREQMNRLVGLYSTLKGQFDQLQAQRVKELTLRVNNGPTELED